MTKQEIRKSILQDIEFEECAIIECSDAIDKIMEDVQEIKNEITARKRTIRGLKKKLTKATA